MPDRAQRMQRGYIYYLDGAGGGRAWSNWSGGVRDGLLAAGYDGAGEMFSWETGLGVAADQVASNEYKRQKARELAGEIEEYVAAHPTAPVYLIGLSAGTAIAVFALEELSPRVTVDNVILLSGSLSATHDLTAALRHVRGKMYIFTSQRDSVLMVMLPLAGTADRESGTVETIGVDGAMLPAGASAETRQAYASKIVVVPRNQQFARYGDTGAHTDAVKPAIVQHFVAPLVPTRTARPGAAGTAMAQATPRGGQVENPDYRRWARFAPGAWVRIEGVQVIDGVRQPVNIKVTLRSKTGDSLSVEREYLSTGSAAPTQVLAHRLLIPALIDPRAHPLTHPATKAVARGNEAVLVGAQSVECRVQSVTASGDFRDWGRDARGVVWQNEQIPGGIARIEMTTALNGRKVEFAATAAEWSASPAATATH
jgi:hypothetical protein